MKKYYRATGFLLAVLVIGLNFYVYGMKSKASNSFTVNFFNDRGQRIQGTFHVPPAPAGGYAKNSLSGLLSVHYGLQNREALQPQGVFLAENGVVVLEIILPPRGDDGKPRSIADYLCDVRAGADILRVQDGVDPARIYLSGHSIGANLTSIEGASAKNIAGVIAIGYPVDFPPDSPCHFLMMSGIFDELHQPSKIIRAFEKTLPSPQNGVILNDSKRIPRSVGHTPARICCFSHLSDHYLEPTDPHIAEGILRFIRATGPESKKADEPLNTGIFYLRILTRPLLFILFFLVFSRLLFTAVAFQNKGIAGADAAKRAPITAFAVAYIFISILYRPSEDLFPAVILSALFIGAISMGYFLSQSEKGRLSSPAELYGLYIKNLLSTLVYGLIIFMAFLAGLYFHAGLYAYGDFSRFLKTVSGGAYVAPGLLYVAISRINGLFLKGDWMMNPFSLPVWIITGAEFIRPGIVWGILSDFFSAVIKNLRKLDFSIKLQGSARSAVLLLVVITGAFLAWRQILAEGYMVTGEELFGLAFLFACFIIIPAAVFTVAVRHKGVRKAMEKINAEV